MSDTYRGLRIASINGQGSEGCGVQRTTGELQIWAKKNGATVDFYSFDVKKYTRSNAHDMDTISFKTKDIPTIASRINNGYDIVMFMSYPNNKYPIEDSKAFYFNLFEEIKKPLKAVFIHEIHSLNIDKITFLIPMVVNADIVFHFDVDTWFSKAVDSLGLKKVGERLFKYTLWANFDDLDRYRQKFVGAKVDGLVSMTRWSSLKNVDRSVRLMDIIQKKRPDYDCAIYGIERSIGAKTQIIDMPEVTYINNGSLTENGNGPVRVYGPINRSNGLDKIASHKFASSFFSLPKAPQNYGSRMEYTQIEIIGVGTVPIFDRHWAENNRLSDGRRYIDVPYSAIYTDGTDLDSVADKIISVSSDEVEMKKYLDESYKLIKGEFDADVVIPRTIELIKSVGKNQSVLSIHDICEKFINKEFTEAIDTILDAGDLPVLGIGEFTSMEAHRLVDGKQELVKKCAPSKKKSRVVPGNSVKSLF